MIRCEGDDQHKANERERFSFIAEEYQQATVTLAFIYCFFLSKTRVRSEDKGEIGGLLRFVAVSHEGESQRGSDANGVCVC